MPRDPKIPWHAKARTTRWGIDTDWQQFYFYQFLNCADGKDKFNCMEKAVALTWPEFTERVDLDEDGPDPVQPVWSIGWNPWLERMLKAFNNTKWATKRGDTTMRVITLTGCGGASKTHTAGLFSLFWWMLDPQNSICTFTSTTVDMIRQRIWPVVSHYWQEARHPSTGERLCEMGLLGDKVDSQLVIRARKGDDKHAIKALAVAHGETTKAVHNLKGRHAKRMLLVVDEANGTPEAIFEVIPNMRKGCQDLTVIIIGNPASRLDPHGRALTPEEGWNAITEDRLIWKTKAVPEWQLDPGIALRFDGKESPNVKAGKTLYPYIYTFEDWQNAHATPNYVGTANYYFMDRGLHLPEGMSCTVFTEQLFARCMDTHAPHIVFESDTQMIAFLDPAFTAGGDEAYFRVAKMGKSGGKWRIQLLDGYAFPISPDLAAYDIDYQLARKMQAECVTRKVSPNCAGVDCTGGGRSIGAILAAEWSQHIHYQTWGGAASDGMIAAHDGQKACDLYANKVTELWWNVRTALENGQIVGFSRTEMVQGCARLYSYKGRRIQVEPKDEMKARVRYSPDQMDSVAGLLAVAMANGFELEGRLANDPTPREVLDDVLGLGLPKVDVHGDAMPWADADVNDKGEGNDGLSDPGDPVTISFAGDSW